MAKKRIKRGQRDSDCVRRLFSVRWSVARGGASCREPREGRAGPAHPGAPEAGKGGAGSGAGRRPEWLEPGAEQRQVRSGR